MKTIFRFTLLALIATAFCACDDDKSYVAPLDVTPNNLAGTWQLGAIIYGNYDYSVGDWQHRYIVTDFSKTQMIWTAKDDRSDISVYERCDGIPEEITGGKTE